MSFELLIYSPTTERIRNAGSEELEAYGIEMKIRTIDTTQYIKALTWRDFDMVSSSFSANRIYLNLMIVWNLITLILLTIFLGVMDPVVDALT